MSRGRLIELIRIRLNQCCLEGNSLGDLYPIGTYVHLKRAKCLDLTELPVSERIRVRAKGRGLQI
jgi:hypothetical protein